jgi:hypothetical protein
MTPKIAVLQNRYIQATKEGGKMALAIAALDRDAQDITQKLNAAIRERQDVRPIMAEVRDNLLERVQLFTTYAENLKELAALSQQTADEIRKIVQS